MKRKTAFTLVELLVVISIIALLAAIVLPSLGRAKEMARRAVCVSHIKSIVVAMRSYATNDESKLFPSDSPYMTGTGYIGVDRASATAGNGRAGQSRSLFLLIRQDYVGQKAFLCPSTPHKINKDTDPDVNYDFATEKELSYSYQVQKQTQNGSAGFTTSLMDDEELVVFADGSPISGRDSWQDSGTGRKASPTADGSHTMESGLDEFTQNSYNHMRDGQNVGFSNGRVAFARNPAVGPGGSNEKYDNIWGWRDSSGEDQMSSAVETAYARSGVDADNALDKRRDSFLWP